MEVPTKTSLAEVYPKEAIEKQTRRWQNLLDTFQETYGKQPDFISRSPGRVNIIGEVPAFPLTKSETHVNMS
jgi:galactokinase